MSKRLRWFLPTWHGDIRLEKLTDNETELHYAAVTDPELKALRLLRDEAVKRGWAKPEAFDQLDNGDPTQKSEDRVIDIGGPIAEIQAILAEHLHLGRTLVTACKFSGGRMEEVRHGQEPPAKAEAVATVPKPTRGCPAPAFSPAEHRASEVLRTFLTDQQVMDFDSFQQFVTVGADTGHRYMLTSRAAPARLRECGGRQLYDLDEERSYCVHYDDDVPPAEELLALHLFLSLSGHETYLREVEDAHDDPYE